MAQDALGAMLSIVASVISIAGVNIQKYAHSKNKAKETPGNYLLMPVWWLGMLGVIFGALGDFVALGLGGQALVAAVGGATTLSVNILFAKFWHKEKLYNLDLLGVALIVVGAVIIAAIAPASKEYTLSELLQYSKATPFVLYIVVLLSVTGYLLASVVRTATLCVP